ncbi:MULTISPECIES: MFS transporter [Mycobacteriaceae]|uniref:MFS transporter n=1 Tax=Mycolicibacterium mucogenicum DSM 44124 TaxID=1226753 RepID=A0A8H2JDU9_MYCMU|nr:MULTISPECIES: MFS transporter [Mycobacteriaceae]KAB7753148.1 major facilitator transporter [Mycolicibacterium mucogenicum DSM 44124]QPG67231.1 MFS transporter [Mycolicibacterium mucogenicum DSM 44124]
MTDIRADPVTIGSWRELLGPRYLGASTVLAGGVALYATNEFLTISLLPSAVTDIGGGRLYAWVTTVYLVASVMAATTVSAMVARFGPRRAYLLGFSVFALGSVVCALAPTMEVMLAGRVVQGAAGGTLAGLGYAVINTALPQSLWPKASALVSAMWGVGTLLGPSAGGLFAQLGVWRWAFGALAILTVAVMVLVPLSLPGRSGDREHEPLRIPAWSLVILGSAAMAISVAGIQRSVPVMVVLLAAGVALVGVFIVVDRRMPVSVLPRTAYGPGPFKWIYVTLGVLMAATMADMYVPLYGQRLAGLVPLTAGFLAVALSVGWTVSEIVSASVTTPARVVRIVAAAPLVMAIGLGAAALSQVDGASPAVVAVWAFSLLITGVGVGMAWPHLSVWAMGRVDDPAQGTVAAAAINTVQLICGAFGAGLAGIVVNTVDRPDAIGATWLFAVFAGLAALGCVASFRAGKGVG